MGIIRWDDHRPDDRGRRVTDDAGAGDDGRPDERCPESAQSLPDPRVTPRPACTPRLCRATFGHLRQRLATFGHLPPSLARPQCSARVFAEPHPLGDPRRVASAPRAGPHRLTGRRLSVDRPGRRRGEGERTKPGRPRSHPSNLSQSRGCDDPTRGRCSRHRARARPLERETLLAFEMSRNRSRLSLDAAAHEEGMTIGSRAQVLGISWELAGRMVHESRGGI